MYYLLILVLLFLAELFYFKVADRCNIIDKPNERSSRLCKLNCVMLYSHSISSVGERPAPRGGTTRPDECKITTI